MAKVLSCSRNRIIKKLITTCASCTKPSKRSGIGIFPNCGPKINPWREYNNLPLFRCLSTSPTLCANDKHSFIKNDPETKSILRDILTDFESETKHQDRGHDNEVNNDPSEVSEQSNKFKIKDTGDSTTSNDKSNASDNYSYDYEEFIDDEHDVVYEHVVERVIPISLERGIEGVYDIGELVKLLETENTKDICVIQVPKEYNYVNQIVIGTAKSTRQLTAIAEEVKLLYKKKRGKGDLQSVKIEGENCNDWKALDLGNIALHLFLQETRKLYDLETLWTVGAEYDPMSVEEEDDYGLYLPFRPDEEGIEELAQYVKKKREETENGMRKTSAEEIDQALEDFTNLRDFQGDNKNKR